MAPSKPWAIIVGAGPSGLLLALMLARQNIPVRVLDMAPALDEQPRATHYAPPAVHELLRAGVLDDIRKAGFDPVKLAFRQLDQARTTYAALDCRAIADNPERMVCLPLNSLTEILLDHLTAIPHAVVSWGYKVGGIGQDADKAWVDVEGPNGKETLSAAYIIGCDGANSQVRRSLFGDWEFPGFTWDEQIVATNLYFPFDKYGYEDANFFIDKQHWHMASKITKDGLWRVTYGETPGLSRDEMLARHPDKMKAILPGPDSWRLANFSPYRVHQRLAKNLRVGRFCLAADAAHLCNPFGGLGLTGGIVDVGGLYDCLFGIYTGRADDSILEKYDEVRRQKYNDIINPLSTANIKRMWQEPEGLLERDEFLQFAKKTETDPEAAIQGQLGLNAVMHDFTQYYTTTERKAENAAHTGSLPHDMKAPLVAVGPE